MSDHPLKPSESEKPSGILPGFEKVQVQGFPEPMPSEQAQEEKAGPLPDADEARQFKLF